MFNLPLLDRSQVVLHCNPKREGERGRGGGRGRGEREGERDTSNIFKMNYIF
jgi:hypothetical protein